MGFVSIHHRLLPAGSTIPLNAYTAFIMAFLKDFFSICFENEYRFTFAPGFSKAYDSLQLAALNEHMHISLFNFPQRGTRFYVEMAFFKA